LRWQKINIQLFGARGGLRDAKAHSIKEGMNKEQLQKIQEFYRQRYGEQNEPK
jgi:hypothetical protein